MAHIQILGKEGYEYYQQITNQKDLNKVKEFVNNINLSELLKIEDTGK